MEYVWENNVSQTEARRSSRVCKHSSVLLNTATSHPQMLHRLGPDTVFILKSHEVPFSVIIKLKLDLRAVMEKAAE